MTEITKLSSRPHNPLAQILDLGYTVCSHPSRSGTPYNFVDLEISHYVVHPMRDLDIILARYLMDPTRQVKEPEYQRFTIEYDITNIAQVEAAVALRDKLLELGIPFGEKFKERNS